MAGEYWFHSNDEYFELMRYVPHACNEIFEFVNLSRPQENLSSANRRLVRRNATLHRSRGRRTPQTAEEGSSRMPSPCDPKIGVRLRLFPIEMQKYMYHVLEYVEHVISPSLFPVRTMYRHNPVHQLIMCLTLQDPRVLNSAVAVACLHRSLYSNGARSDVIISLEHEQKASAMLRDWLAGTHGSQVDAAAVVCVMHLASLELMRQNFEGWSLHMSALRKMAENPNAKASLAMIQFAFLETELVGCYFFDQQPSYIQDKALLISQFEFTPIRLHALDQGHAETLHFLFSGDNDTNAIDKDLISYVLELRSLTRMINPLDPTTLTDVYVYYYMSSRISVEYRLLQLWSKTDLSEISNVMCIATQIYVNMVLRTFKRGMAIFERHAARMKNCIEIMLSESALDTPLPPSMLWAAALGAIATRNNTLRTWFVRLVHHVRCGLGYQKGHEVQELLNSFLWSERQFNCEAVELWEEVRALRI